MRRGFITNNKLSPDVLDFSMVKTDEVCVTKEADLDTLV